MVLTAGEGVTVSAQMVVEPWMQGGPGVIHGGVLTAAFDEALGNAPLLIGSLAVTVHLEIDFAKPIPLGSTLRFESTVDGVAGRKVYVTGQAWIEETDTPVAAAHGIFVVIDPRRHYADYVGKWVRSPEASGDEGR